MTYNKQILHYGMLHKLKKFVCLWLLFIAMPVASVQAAAPVPADSPCDPNYRDSMESRAWLEAQREITQNQNLIYKPDSVLEYTCFDHYLKELADHAEDMFSESKRWLVLSIIPGSMATSLNLLVGTAVITYIKQNFDHTFLGGRSSLDYSPSTISRGSYDCDRMNMVWMEAKCMDFISNSDTDGFYTFEEYRDEDDRRRLPEQCTSINGRWENELNIAYLDETITPWEEDVVTTFFDLLDPPNCAAAIPIKTGLVVRRRKGPQVFYEKFCTPPGCHYVPTGGGSLNSPSDAGTCQP